MLDPAAGVTGFGSSGLFHLCPPPPVIPRVSTLLDKSVVLVVVGVVVVDSALIGTDLMSTPEIDPACIVIPGLVQSP